MTNQLEFLVDRRALEHTRWSERPLPAALQPNQLLLQVERFALTANNITYAVAGESMHYWQFFPVDEAWGLIPVWGFAVVVDSAHPEVAVGERLYGYYPMASHLLIEAGQVSSRQLLDVSAHRQDLARVYNQYQRIEAAAGYSQEAEDAQMLYRPLFTTSFLLDDFLADSDFFAAARMILTSASSKTSLGLAHLLHQRGGRVRVVGVTSPANIGFVAGLGCYDEVLSYDDIDQLPLEPSVVVDMAGNGGALKALHDRLDDALRYSCLVGATHWDARSGAAGLRGPKPELFFAPSHVERRMQAWGPRGFEAKLEQAWSSFSANVAGWIEVEHHAGPEAVERAYRLLLSGEAQPDRGLVLSLAG